MIRRGLATWGVVLAMLVPAGATAADAPPGPRLATLELGEVSGSPPKEKPPRVSLATISPEGKLRRRYLERELDVKGRATPLPFQGPAWSSDGERLVFAGTSGKSTQLFALAVDDGRVRPLPGTKRASNPVLSADGRRLAFARTRSRSYIDVKHITEPDKDRSYSYSSTTTWVVDLSGGKPRRLTGWRNGLSNVPTSFVPDGSALAVTKTDGTRLGPEVVLINPSDGDSRSLLARAEEAVFSPDGSQIVFVSYLVPDPVETAEGTYLASDLYVVGPEGTGVRRLTNTDDVVESVPSWDPAGQRIAYVRDSADASVAPGLGLLFPYGNALMQVNADGTCREKVITQRKVAFYGAAWQPGPGREAGHIVC